MPLAFVPDATCGWTGEIEVEFVPPIGTGSGDSHWTFSVESEKARINPERARHPGLRLTMSPPTFFKLVAGTLNSVEAWLDGRAVVDGDPTVAARLIEMFSGPAPEVDIEGE